MLTQLQAMATPSGGMAPTGATAAAFTSGAEAALRRAHPARVAMLFALASIAVLAVVFVLRQRLGLPDWVLPGAAVLLAIGLPIMLVTGTQGARARARCGDGYVSAYPMRASRSTSPGARRSWAAGSRSERSPRS